MQKNLKIGLIVSAVLVSALGAKDVGVVSVSSMAFKTTQNEATSGVEVWTKEDIQKSKARDIYEFLNEQTSVVTMPSYGNSYSQIIDLRGYGIANGYENMVIMVDGQRLNNIDMSPQLLSTIPIEHIQKIEIIKGSGSVEYGNGATAGVINIITDTKNQNQLKAYMGNYNTKYGLVSAGYNTNKFIINAMIDSYSTDGIKDDDSKSQNKNVGISYFPTNKLEIRVKKYQSDIDVNYPGSLTKDEFNHDITKKKSLTEQKFYSDMTSFGLTYNLSSRVVFDVDYNIQDKTSKYVTYSSKSDYDYKELTSKLKIKQDSLKFLVGFSIFNGSRDGSNNTTSKKNSALFADMNYLLNNLVVSVGVRKEKIKYKYDPNSGNSLDDSENLNAYNIGLNYKKTVFVNYNKAYLTPDIDRFFNWGGTFNRFIDPQTSKTLNVGFNHFVQNNKFKLTLFRADLTNEIYYNPITWSNTNIDKSHKQGVELFDRYQINKAYYTSINYTYIDAKIDKEGSYDGNDLPGVSKHNATINLGFDFTKLSALLSHKYRSKAYAMNDFGNNFSQKQAEYQSTNVSLKYKQSKNISLFVKAKNIFSHKNALWVRDDAIYPVNYTATYYAGIDAKF